MAKKTVRWINGAWLAESRLLPCVGDRVRVGVCVVPPPDRVKPIAAARAAADALDHGQRLATVLVASRH